MLLSSEVSPATLARVDVLLYTHIEFCDSLYHCPPCILLQSEPISPTNL